MMAPPTGSIAVSCVRRALAASKKTPARRRTTSTFASTSARTSGISSVNTSRQLHRQPHALSCAFSTLSSTAVDDKSSDNNVIDNNSKKIVESLSQAALPPVDQLIEDVKRACTYNQGNPKSRSRRKAREQYYWDYEFCRTTADVYETYLLGMADNPQSFILVSPEEREALLDTDLVGRAFGMLLKCKLIPTKLSARVRDWERALGTLAVTSLTDRLSLKLMEANGKAGNVGRVLSLLENRTQQGFEPRESEFVHAVTSIEVAGWYLRENRNIFLGDQKQPVIDNPTRWLDAILLNMSKRNFALTQDMAVRMLDTFSSRGRTGKAKHYFYSVRRTPLDRAEDDVSDSRLEEELDMDDEGFDKEDDLGLQRSNIPSLQKRPYKVRLKLNSTAPPSYKIPTDIKGQLVTVPHKKQSKKGKGKPSAVLKLDRETDPDWSEPLSAAFSFAESLAHGACGHDPVELNLVCYNVLIKACVYRGALWRAMNLIDTVMPAAHITPDHRSYNSLLSGFARVGDVSMMREYNQQMLSKGVAPDYYTVQCIVDGLLSLGDVAGAITVIQDFFNQHNVLPPVTTQLKVLEFALGLDMVYEAKRHVYFIQQLWKWQPHYQYESRDFIYFMKTYQQDPRISQKALQHLFKYFGTKLDESDFF